MMIFRKFLAVIGLLFSPIAWAAMGEVGEAQLTVILSVLLIINPATQFLGSIFFSSLLINYGAGNVRRGFGFEYIF